MPGKIFINYRRGDDPGFTQALYQRLEEEFSAADLFMDIEGHIKPGDDFVEVLNGQVADCDVMLAVIGPRWAVLMEARGGSADDFVTIEIKTALDQGKRVIPVLVGGASMPASETLPEPVRALARRNAVGLRPERFKADCQGLVNALREQLAAAQQERAARTEAGRAAAEAERLAREAEEAARIAAAEERARAQAVAGLSQEEIRKAEELANWDFIKERGDAQLLRDHLARFPDGVTALYARTRIEELTWAGLGPSPDTVALGAFIEEFPNGTHTGVARSRLADLEKRAAEARKADEQRARETSNWGAVTASTDQAAIQAFLDKWPDGQHAPAAESRLRELGRGGRSTRRALVAATGGAAFVTFVPGMPVWRYFNDRSLSSVSAHSGGVASVAIMQDGRRVVSSGLDGTIRVWELAGESLRPLNQFGLSSSIARPPIAVGRDEVVVGDGPEIKVWEPSSGRVRTVAATDPIPPLLPPRADGGILMRELWSSVAVTPDGRRGVSAGDFGTIKVWELANGRQVSNAHHRSTVRSIVVTRDGRQMISGSATPRWVRIAADGTAQLDGENSIKVWDLASGRFLRTLEGHTAGVTCVTATADRLICGSEDGTIKVWEVANGGEVTTIGHSVRINAIAVIPNSQHVIAACGDATIAVYDVSGALPSAGSSFSYPLLSKLTGHSNWAFEWTNLTGRFNVGVNSVAVTPDGRRAISGGGDGTVKVWDISWTQPTPPGESLR